MHPTLELEPDFPLPGIIALELGIDRRERTIDHMTRSHVGFVEIPDGSLVVPAREANGAMLFFSEEGG
jgi:hypothetical protein